MKANGFAESADRPNDRGVFFGEVREEGRVDARRHDFERFDESRAGAIEERIAVRHVDTERIADDLAHCRVYRLARGEWCDARACECRELADELREIAFVRNANEILASPDDADHFSGRGQKRHDSHGESSSTSRCFLRAVAVLALDLFDRADGVMAGSEGRASRVVSCEVTRNDSRRLTA